MFPFPDQISGVTKANFEAQLALFTDLSNKAFEGVEQIVDLNLNAAKASLEDSASAARQLLAAKDAQEFLTLAAAQAQPSAAKAIAYGRTLAAIASSVQGEFSRATEEQIAETGRKVSALVDDVTKNAPAGSENVIALFKSAIGNANAGYEQLNKTSKQAMETMEANMASAVSQFTQATEKTTTRARAAK